MVQKTMFMQLVQLISVKKMNFNLVRLIVFTATILFLKVSERASKFSDYRLSNFIIFSQEYVFVYDALQDLTTLQSNLNSFHLSAAQNFNILSKSRIHL